MKPDGMTLVKVLSIPCTKLPDYDLSKFGNVMFSGVQLGIIPGNDCEIVKIKHPSHKGYQFFMFLSDDRNDAVFILHDKKNHRLSLFSSTDSPAGTFRWMCEKHLEWKEYMENKETEAALAKMSRQADREHKKRMKQYAKGADHRG